MIKKFLNIIIPKSPNNYDYDLSQDDDYKYEKSPIVENISDAIDDKVDYIAEKLGIERKPKWERDMEKWEKDYDKKVKIDFEKTLMQHVNELNVGDIFEYLSTYYEVILTQSVNTDKDRILGCEVKYCIAPPPKFKDVKTYRCLGTLEEKKEKLIERNVKIFELAYDEDYSFNTFRYKLKIILNNAKDTMRNVNRKIKSNKYEEVSEYNLNLGDHILVQYLGYTHHAIYIGDGVIEQSKKEMVCVTINLLEILQMVNKYIEFVNLKVLNFTVIRKLLKGQSQD